MRRLLFGMAFAGLLLPDCGGGGNSSPTRAARVETIGGTPKTWAPQRGAPVKITLQNATLGQGLFTALLQSTTVSH